MNNCQTCNDNCANDPTFIDGSQYCRDCAQHIERRYKIDKPKKQETPASKNSQQP